MKKLSLIIGFVLSTAILFAQEPVQTWEGLQKQKEKTDKEIKDSKKQIKSKTWAKRGQIYLDIARFNTTGLYVGLPMEGIAGAEFMVGKPQKKEELDGKETWIYPHKKLIFENKKLTTWEETDFIDKDAYKKASEAMFKAKELDEKGKFANKSTTKQQTGSIRAGVVNIGIDYYEKRNFEPAYDYLVLSINILQI